MSVVEWEEGEEEEDIGVGGFGEKMLRFDVDLSIFGGDVVEYEEEEEKNELV